LGIRIGGLPSDLWLGVCDCDWGFAIAIRINSKSSKRGKVYFLICKCVCVIYDCLCLICDWVCDYVIVHFWCHFLVIGCGAMILCDIVCHSPLFWYIPLCFPNLVIVIVSGLGLCACFFCCRFCFFQSCDPCVFFMLYWMCEWTLV